MSPNNNNPKEDLLTTVLEKTLDPVHNPDHQHQTTGAQGVDANNSSDNAMTENGAQSGAATPAPSAPSSSSKPSFRRLASAGLNKPFQIAGSIKRGFSSNRVPSSSAGTGASTPTGLSTMDEDGSRGSLDGPRGEGSVPPPAIASGSITAQTNSSTSVANPNLGTSSTELTRLKPSLKPLENEPPLAILRVRILRATSLTSRDRNGLSDPYLVLSLPPTPNKQTPSVKKSLNPSWEGEKEREKSTFDFPLYESLGKGAGVYEGRGVEVVVWDRDFGGVRKDYMGEVCVRLGEWEEGGLVWKENMQVSNQGFVCSCRPRRALGS
jgi:hypothetical protein